MWFKNARLYRLLAPITVDLSEVLPNFAFQPCGDLDPLRYGFVPPIPGGEMFTHAGDHCGMICAKRQEKILPAAAVKTALEEKVAAIRASENRPVGRAERNTLKDEIIFSMLPKAFTRTKLEYAYIDLKLGLIIVDSPSANRAEDLLSKLREAIGSLKCIPLSTKDVPSIKMTHWVAKHYLPNYFQIGSDIQLESSKDGRVVRCKNHDWTASEILNHIESGMNVTKLQLIWRDGITFSVDQELAIKGIKFGDVISDKANDGNPETKAEQFDMDFRIMSFELRSMFTDLLAAFGGEETHEG